MKDLLCSKDPWEGRRCERRKCLPCCGDETEGAGISCQKENVTYTIKCRKCAREGKSAMYWGETARNGFKRGVEHADGLKNEWEKAPLWRHTRLFHGGEKNLEWFSMRVERSHRSPLNR